MNTIQQKESFLNICKDVAKPEQWERFNSGDLMVHAGDYLSKVYIIKSGLFKVCLEHREQKLTIGYLSTGSFTGLIGGESNFQYPYSIKTVADSEVYVWDRNKISELLTVFPGIANELKSTSSLWAMKLVDRLKTFAFLADYQRVACWVFDFFKYNDYYGNNIWSLLSEKEMAEYCLVGIDEFKNSMKQLALSNIIRYSHLNCELLDAKRLKFIIQAEN
jgi:hypothetical protein